MIHGFGNLGPPRHLTIRGARPGHDPEELAGQRNAAGGGPAAFRMRRGLSARGAAQAPFFSDLTSSPNAARWASIVLAGPVNLKNQLASGPSATAPSNM